MNCHPSSVCVSNDQCSVYTVGMLRRNGVTLTWLVVGNPLLPKLTMVFGLGGYPNSECTSLGIAYRMPGFDDVGVGIVKFGETVSPGLPFTFAVIAISFWL